MKPNLQSLPALIIIFVLWIAPGLFGREPWKADEPYSFGIVTEMMRTGDWVEPRLTGEPFLEKPPLFFVTAARFGRMFSPPLELYDSTRLAAAFFMALVFLFAALAARELYGEGSGALAFLLLLGCAHLQVTAHKMITDVGLFAGFSMALYGLALSARRRIAGGFWLGTGTGIGFLTKGLLAPGMLGITALALPALFPRWRRKDYVLSLAVALVAALPWLVVWPTALYRRSPELFVHWFWNQNFGRFLGFNPGGSVGFNVSAPDPHDFYLRNMLGLGWPVVLPALWALWRFRRSWREHPLFQLPLVSFVMILGILSASSTSRTLYAVPLLLPLTFMAVPAMNVLSDKVKIIVNRVSVLFFGLFALLLWFGWLAMMTASPAVIAQKLQELFPDYVPSFSGVLLAIAVLYTLAWLFMVFKVTRAPEHAAMNWALGMVFVWALSMTIWLPALNASSSYRAAFTTLKKSMPADYTCLASHGLAESERAMFEYYTGLQTRRIEAVGPGNCDLFLEVRDGAAPVTALSREWKKIGEFVRRPNRSSTDIFTLYKKPAGPRMR